MDKALLLLQIQKQALESVTQKELGFHAVNATKKLVPYRRAIFWTKNGKDISLQNISGNSILDQNGPHGEWLKKIIRQNCKNALLEKTFLKIDTSNLSPEEITQWLDNAAPYAALIIMRYGEDSTIIGGLWIERETPFKDGEGQILEELGFYYSRALVMSRLQGRREFLPLSDRVKPYRRYIWILLILLAFFPVRLTINAPTEVIATSAETVSVPFDGILTQIDISPGDRVEKDSAVASMDIESLRLETETSSEALRAAQGKLSRLRREVLSNPEKKIELSRLLSDIKTKEIESTYAKSQLDKAVLRAPRAGVAIFADKNDLQNKPVKTGQAIMQIADPDQIELLVRVPLGAMLPIDNGADITFYPNAMPLNNFTANIKTIGYQASQDSDGLLTYKIRANLKDQKNEIRIGWKGVSKISGNWTVLIYKILRRPIITIRSTLGV